MYRLLAGIGGDNHGFSGFPDDLISWRQRAAEASLQLVVTFREEREQAKFATVVCRYKII